MFYNICKKETKGYASKFWSFTFVAEISANVDYKIYEKASHGNCSVFCT